MTRTSPAAAAHLLTAPAPDDPTAALVGAAGLIVWAVALWLLLATAVTAGGHLPGLAGRAAAGASRRVAPATVRRVLEIGLGLAVTTAALGTSPAGASWAPQPADPPSRAVPTLDWAAAPVVEPVPRSVVVAPGDSLWALAERDLAQRSDAAPTDAAIARAWPSWWAVNREAVGPDPHLLRPGMSLTPPAHP